MCNALESQDEPLASCDRCGSKTCKSCADLSSTELRAVILKKRVIIFLCPGCRPLQDAAPDISAVKDALLDQIRGEFAVSFASIASTIQAEVGNHTSYISGELAAIRRTNIDLIELLSRNQSAPLGPPQVVNAPGKNQQAAFQKSDPPHARNVASRRPPVVAQTQEENMARSSVRSVPKAANRSHPAGGSTAGYQRPVIVGTRRVSSTKLAAANVRKKTSVFVSRLDGSVTADILLDYLHTTFGPTEEFLIEEQTIRSGDYRGFRVEAGADLRDQLLSEKNWPENIFIKRFRFPRPNPQASK